MVVSFENLKRESESFLSWHLVTKWYFIHQLLQRPQRVVSTTVQLEIQQILRCCT